nr:hypothetical protein [Rhodococcus sp. ZPP]
MRHGTTREVPTDLLQRQPRRDIVGAGPELDRAVGARQPCTICVGHEDRNIPECLRPLGLDAEHVRMTGRDREYGPVGGHSLDRGRVDMADRIPQQRSGRGAQHQRLLADRDLRLHRQSAQPGFEFALDNAVTGTGEVLGGRPLLTTQWDVLAFVRTDCAFAGKGRCWVLFDAARGAEMK